LRRALVSESKNGLLKHSTSYPVLDENVPTSEAESPKPESDGDSMAMDEDYMFDSVNVDKVERGVAKTVDVDKLKQTLSSIRTKRDRQQVSIFNSNCS
jgi:hypothetical protein